jgi:hypothetical protein
LLLGVRCFLRAGWEVSESSWLRGCRAGRFISKHESKHLFTVLSTCVGCDCSTEEVSMRMKLFWLSMNRPPAGSLVKGVHDGRVARQFIILRRIERFTRAHGFACLREAR